MAKKRKRNMAPPRINEVRRAGFGHQPISRGWVIEPTRSVIAFRPSPVALTVAMPSVRIQSRKPVAIYEVARPPMTKTVTPELIKPNVPVKKAKHVTKMEPAKQSPTVRDKITCKARPEGQTARRAGGSPKRFVPWCDRK